MLYPLVGLEITDDTHDLEEPKPFFVNATLLSPKHVQDYVDKWKSVQAIPGFGGEFLVGNMNHEIRGTAESYNSFIAVSGLGNIRKNKQEREKLIKQADERAYEIAALLNLTVLAHWLSSQTIALVAQLRHGTNNRIWINFETGESGTNVSYMSSFAALDPQGALSWSRDELRQHLYRAEFVHFTRAFELGRSYQNNLLTTIRNSAVRLADAVHTVDPAPRLLGAVTSLEILFDSQPYEVTKNRLLALLGRHLYDQYKAEPVFSARHDYVHRGQTSPAIGIADDAIYLALSAILRYSTLSTAFVSKKSSKEKLWSYLDFVYSGMKRWFDWDVKERRAFKTFLRHDIDAPIFPYDHEPS